MTEYAEKIDSSSIKETPLRLPFIKMKALPGNLKLKEQDKKENKTDELDIPFEEWKMPSLEPGRIKCPRYDFF